MGSPYSRWGMMALFIPMSSTRFDKPHGLKDTYVVKGLLPSNSARYTNSVELHYESGKMKTRRFLLLQVLC